MRYYLVGQMIMLEGQSLNPIKVSSAGNIEGIISYLNAQNKTIQKHRDVLFRLLKVSLDGVNQIVIQNEVAKMLGYPGIQEFIKETYGDNPSKERKKEEKILVVQGISVDESKGCVVCEHNPCECVGL